MRTFALSKIQCSMLKYHFMKKQFFLLVFLLFAAGITMHAQQRKVLFEEFTSSTCGPCAQMNAWLNPLLANNAEKVVVVKYQMDWPGSGDPYYTAEGGTRRGFYGVNAVPDPYTNGVYTGSQGAIQNAINNGYAKPAEATIEGGFKIIGNLICIEANVTPLISGSNYFIHCVVNEKVTTQNKKTNGETEFYHVMMKMFPNGNGTTVTLTEGETIPLKFSHDMSTTHVEEMDDLEVVVFVQNKSTKAVLNAAYLTENNITLPLPPANFAATQQGETLNINLSWTAVSGASGYNIYRNGVQLNTTPVTGTTYQDVVDEYGKTYNYGAIALVGGVESFEAKTTALTNVTIPMPTITSVKQTRGKEMLIEWEMPAGFETPVKYYLYRNDVKQGSLITGTSVIHKGSYYEKEYCFEVQPILNEITGTKSNSVCIRMVEVPQPQNLEVEQVNPTSSKILLTWDASRANTAGYNVYRDKEKINTELITETSYTDTTPGAGTYTYTYQLYGVAETGAESEKYAEAKITFTVGIDDITNDALFSFYPNPVSGTLNINTKEPITDCQIFNIQGQMIYSTQSNVKEIATDNWTSGVYIIRITTEKGIAEKRFIKN